MTSMTQRDIAGLAQHLRGALLRPDDEGYEQHRRVWNGMIDRHPALIARCQGVSDVVEVVNLARQQDLLLAVRGGGRCWPAAPHGRPDHLHGLDETAYSAAVLKEPFLRNAQTGLFRYALWGPSPTPLAGRASPPDPPAVVSFGVSCDGGFAPGPRASAAQGLAGDLESMVFQLGALVLGALDECIQVRFGERGVRAAHLEQGAPH